MLCSWLVNIDQQKMIMNIFCLYSVYSVTKSWEDISWTLFVNSPVFGCPPPVPNHPLHNTVYIQRESTVKCSRYIKNEFSSFNIVRHCVHINRVKSYVQGNLFFSRNTCMLSFRRYPTKPSQSIQCKKKWRRDIKRSRSWVWDYIRAAVPYLPTGITCTRILDFGKDLWYVCKENPSSITQGQFAVRVYEVYKDLRRTVQCTFLKKQFTLLTVFFRTITCNTA